jgi:DNA-directed RNA polymerase subunit RPC12/RpoP
MCGHSCNLAEPVAGPEMRCPACFSLFPVKPAAASPLLARSVAAPPPAAPAVNRTILAQPEAMIRYTCPRCKKSLESPASFAGQKSNCPDCNQRLQIPQPTTPPAAPPLNKTILAAVEPPSARPAPAVPPVPAANVELVHEAVVAEPLRREHCLECGVDMTRRSRVQTCPDCGSLLCSAACYREHHHQAHAAKKKKHSRPVECEYCGSKEPPYRRSQISPAGWITFALLLVFFFPLFWIGLLMTETEWHCADCGARLD